MPPLAVPQPHTAWADPEAVWRTAAARHRDVFWLDAGVDARSGWSWVGWGELDDEPAVLATRCTGGRQHPFGRFTGGWVGWAGYEPAAARAGAPTAPTDGEVPASAWIRVEGMVGFDHAHRRVWSLGGDDLLRSSSSDREDAPDATQAARTATARHRPEEYAALVARCRDRIRHGDAYQLCLTTRFTVDGALDALAAYTLLRRETPSHHGGFIRAGGASLLSASPERFLEVEGDVVRTHPIKGTRPRGADPSTDRALAAELLASEKERAENVMIVDLMRNDLARVCRPSTVAVDALLEVESYPAVHQLVSTVSGRLPAEATVGDLLRGAFPAGSMTGAPKLSAMTILRELEAGPRGVFAGCFGWVGAEGGLDLAMVIRSIVVHATGAYVGAGGGITWGSVPEQEVAEVALKARAPLAALGASLPAGW